MTSWLFVAIVVFPSKSKPHERPSCTFLAGPKTNFTDGPRGERGGLMPLYAHRRRCSRAIHGEISCPDQGPYGDGAKVIALIPPLPLNETAHHSSIGNRACR